MYGGSSDLPSNEWSEGASSDPPFVNGPCVQIFYRASGQDRCNPCASIGRMALFRRGAAAWLITTILAALVVTLDRHAWPSIAAQAPSTATPQTGEEQARVVCGVCHAFPAPDILPRGAWRDEF